MDSAHWRPRFRFGQAFAAPTPGDDGEADAPRRLARILEDLPAEVVERFSGCGSPIPEAIGNCRVLDLGCGTGRDAFLCASLAGPRGFVMGLDREPELLAVARRNVEEAMTRFGHPEPNVAFRQGLIENLAAAEFEDEGFDVVISNRALNLVPRKLAVLQEVHRVLKPGGEFYFADVYTDRRLPEEIGSDPEVLREQLGGALYVGDFVRKARRAGFADPRIVSRSPLTLTDSDLQVRRTAFAKMASFPKNEAVKRAAAKLGGDTVNRKDNWLSLALKTAALRQGVGPGGGGAAKARTPPRGDASPAL